MAEPRPFIWYELITPDLEGAVRFYGDVVGWEFQDFGPGAMPYKVLTVPGSGTAAGIGGIMLLNDEMKAAGVPACWSGYVHVPDVDATVAQVVAGGGKVMRPAGDIPGVGRFAVVLDPYGAAFMLFKPAPPAGKQPEWPAPGLPGTIGWHELHAGDLEGAWAFYEKLFGWSKVGDMDMGPLGVYRTYATGGARPANEPSDGGMMKRMPSTPGTFWLYYFRVPAIDAAAARVTAGGGTIANGPMEVPGGGWILQGIDPQGAFFALVAPRR